MIAFQWAIPVFVYSFNIYMEGELDSTLTNSEPTKSQNFRSPSESPSRPSSPINSNSNVAESSALAGSSAQAESSALAVRVNQPSNSASSTARILGLTSSDTLTERQYRSIRYSVETVALDRETLEAREIINHLERVNQELATMRQRTYYLERQRESQLRAEGQRFSANRERSLSPVASNNQNYRERSPLTRFANTVLGTGSSSSSQSTPNINDVPLFSQTISNFEDVNLHSSPSQSAESSLASNLPLNEELFDRYLEHTIDTMASTDPSHLIQDDQGVFLSSYAESDSDRSSVDSALGHSEVFTYQPAASNLAEYLENYSGHLSETGVPHLDINSLTFLMIFMNDNFYEYYGRDDFTCLNPEVIIALRNLP